MPLLADTRPNVYLTHPLFPANVYAPDVLADTISYWHGACGSSETALCFTCQQSSPEETHPHLLTRIWREIQQGGPGIRVISETDFLPHPQVLNFLAEQFKENRIRALFATYATRADGTSRELAVYQDVPAPCFLAFNYDPELFRKLPATWLENPVEVDNPAAGAFLQGLAFNVWKQEEVLWVDPTDMRVRDWFPHPLVYYPRLGSHYFYSRHFCDHPHSPLCDTGITVGQHLTHIRAALACAEAAWPLGQSPWGAV